MPHLWSLSRLLIVVWSTKQICSSQKMYEYRVSEIWELDCVALNKNTMGSDWQNACAQALAAYTDLSERRGA